MKCEGETGRITAGSESAGRVRDWKLNPAEDAQTATVTFATLDTDPVWWHYPDRTLELWFASRRLCWDADHWEQISDKTFRVVGPPTVQE